jgi:hypothetical protein
VRKAVGGFLRYIEFRDQNREHDLQGGLEAYVRYVAHRDRTSPAGRLFGREGQLTDADRKRLVDFVARSTKGLQPKWQRNRDGELEDHQRAVYQMILSPEDCRKPRLERRRHHRVDRTGDRFALLPQLAPRPSADRSLALARTAV